MYEGIFHSNTWQDLTFFACFKRKTQSKNFYCYSEDINAITTTSQQKVDNGETVENKTDEIVNKNPTSYFIKEEVTDAEILWHLM